MHIIYCSQMLHSCSPCTAHCERIQLIALSMQEVNTSQRWAATALCMRVVRVACSEQEGNWTTINKQQLHKPNNMHSCDGTRLSHGGHMMVTWWWLPKLPAATGQGRWWLRQQQHYCPPLMVGMQTPPSRLTSSVNPPPSSPYPSSQPVLPPAP